MAEDSAFWAGTTIGHAATTDVWGAPYSDIEFSDFFSKLMQSNTARGFIVPGYGNDLKVQANSPAAMNVLLNTGIIQIRGRQYENTAQQTITLTAADATNPRIDRIVARITFASQTIVAAVVDGTPAATPSLPALTQNATTYEIELAYVWVAANAVSIAETEVHDTRIFAANFEAMLTSLGKSPLLRNTEFLASITARTYPPASWSLVGTPSAIATSTKPAQMVRGNAIQITADAATEGISQSFSALGSTVYSIKALINVTAGDVGVITVTDNGASPATITRNVRRTGTWLEELIYYTTPSDATTMTIQLVANANTDVVQFGQVLAVQGYLPGAFRSINPIESMTLLDEVELSANASSIDFNIPSGFKHLRIIISARGTSATINDLVSLRFNGDSGANYDNGYTVYDGGSWSDVENYGANSLGIGQVAGNNAPASTVGVMVIDIPDYLEATLHHTVMATWYLITATSAPGMRTGSGGGRYRTAGALTAVSVRAVVNFSSGSRFSLYALS